MNTTGRPNSLTDAATSLPFADREITREAPRWLSRMSFPRADGCRVGLRADGARGSRPPWTGQFSYDYKNAPKNAGFAIRPTAAIGLNVSLLSRDMKLVFTRNFRPEMSKGQPSC